MGKTVKTSIAEKETKEFYDEIPFKSVLSKGQKRQSFFKDLNISGMVLDVGVGSGRTSYLLSEIFPDTNIHTLDISQRTLRRIKIENRIQGSALNLPFPDQCFDFVISIGCLHHTPDARKGFSECSRVLKTGGGIAVALYNSWNLYKPIYSLTKRTPRFIQSIFKHPLVADQFFTPHASFHSPKEVRGWFVQEELQLLKLRGTGYIPPYLLNNFSQFIYYFGKKP